MTRKGLIWSLLVVAGMVAVAAYRFTERRHDTSLSGRLEQIVPVTTHRQVPCDALAASRPLVLLALGQSNAGNHGGQSANTAETVTLVAEGKCIKATDPLPGGTGTGGSIWQRLPAWLSTQKDSRPIVLSVMAVDATSIDDWTATRSPLGARLVAHVASMRKLGLAPDLVLWQQGEADALNGTGSDDYSAGLARLAAMLSEAGSNAPIILARSTRCRSGQNTAIRSAIESTVSRDHRFRLGPDTDTLSAETFREGCHLTSEGLESAAKMWAATIIGQASTSSHAPLQ